MQAMYVNGKLSGISPIENGGEVQVPLAETFFAARFGSLVDRFGTPWMINCEQADSLA